MDLLIGTKRKSCLTFLILASAFMSVAGAQTKTESGNFCGHYVFGHEVRTFQPCNTEKVYWVKADEAVSQRLRKAHNELSKIPYASIYIEIQGRIMGKATDGFAADYDGQLFVEQIKIIRERRKDDCRQ
jgi:hypothetical protein